MTFVGTRLATCGPSTTFQTPSGPARAWAGKPARAGAAASVTAAPGAAWPWTEERSACSTMSCAKIWDSHSPPGHAEPRHRGGGGGGGGCSHPSATQSPAVGNAPPGVGTQTPLPKLLPQAHLVALQYGAKSVVALQLHLNLPLVAVSSALWLDVHAEQAAPAGSRLRGHTFVRQTQHG